MFITIPRSPVVRQITFDDLFNEIDFSKFEMSNTHDTVTYCVQNATYKTYEKMNFSKMFDSLENFNRKYEKLIKEPDKSKLYRSFKIPKRSGGLRQIDAPNDELMAALNELKDILERDFYFTYHTCAFAYVRGRSTIDAVKRHQRNGSRWFLKTDLSKFFPSTTPEYLLKMLYKTFPLCSFVQNLNCREQFEKAISLCFLNGGLPQGTPTSPMLTNQMMIPIDFEISKMCHDFAPHLCYTRYADDMTFSSEFGFKWQDAVKKVSEILKKYEAPFAFNDKKTHYGSSAGRNWMLGVMLNKDNKITVGHENKKVFKTMLFSFAMSIKDGKKWSVEDAQHLQGLISYYYMVEGSPIEELINLYSVKHNINIRNELKKIIQGK